MCFLLGLLFRFEKPLVDFKDYKAILLLLDLPYKFAELEKHMQSMRYISRVPAGYLVRKTVNGRLYQGFFGDARFGDKDGALSAAVEYRDGLLQQVAGERSFQNKNARNITGVVGVAWHCRPNTHRKDGVVHSFRAQVAGEEEGRTLSKAWSVQRYGLWGAYEHAVRWRHMIAFGKAVDYDTIVSNFSEFLKNYIEAMSAAGALQTEMRDALVQLAMDPEAPAESIALLPASIQRRFDARPSRPRTSVRKSALIDAEGELAEDK